MIKNGELNNKQKDNFVKEIIEKEKI